jgi:hypothetical protein
MTDKKTQTKAAAEKEALAKAEVVKSAVNSGMKGGRYVLDNDSNLTPVKPITKTEEQ